MNGLQMILWVNFITENLFKNNDFLSKCRIADSNVMNGFLVVLPQAGSKPVVVKNRGTTPATVTKRVDSSIVYPIDTYTTDPTELPFAEQYELSYDKLSSVLGDHVDVLGDTIADNMIFEWLRSYAYTGFGTAAAAPVIRTTGGATASHLVSNGVVTTGNRKVFTKEDLKAMKLSFDKQNIKKADRYALVPSDMMDQLSNDADLKVRDFGGELDFKNGTITRLWGFEIIERSSTSVYTTGGVVKSPEAIGLVSDSDSVVCWQKNSVERALGEVKMFQDIDSPLYYGSIYSGLARMGGRKTRINAEGIGAIVQGV